MIDIVMKVIGGGMATMFLGYLTYSIGSVPLWIITVVVFVLMVTGFYQDHRDELSFSDVQDRQKQAP